MDRRERKARLEAKTQGIEPPHTVLLEMDGIIVDSHAVLYRVYNDLLAKHGRTGTKIEFNTLFGMPLHTFLLTLSDLYGLRRSLEKLEDDYRDLLATHYAHDVPVIPQALKFLEQARQLGLTLGLIASAGLAPTRTVLHAKQLDKEFDVISTGETEHIHETPPNLYQEALDVLGTSSNDTLAIVRSAYSVHASLEADIDSIWLTNNSGGKIPANHHAQCIRLNDWDAILNHIKQCYVG